MIFQDNWIQFMKQVDFSLNNVIWISLCIPINSRTFTRAFRDPLQLLLTLLRDQ